MVVRLTISKFCTVPLHFKKVKFIAQSILNTTPYAKWNLNIDIVTNKRMQKYNREDRGKNKPTDILSYSFYAVCLWALIEIVPSKNLQNPFPPPFKPER